MTERNSTRLYKNQMLLRKIAFITLCFFIFNVIGSSIAQAQVFSQTAQNNLSDALTPITFTIPKHLGAIEDSWNSGAQEKVVIHIQDAHCNYYAQHKISQLIEYLAYNYNIYAVNLEGGKGEYDISILSDIQDRSLRQSISDSFVRDGVVNGAEYFAINNPDKVKLWGIEDIDLYNKNLSAYRDSLIYKDIVNRYLKSLSHILTNLKLHIFHPELLDIDRKYCQYKAHNIDFKDYVIYLLDKAANKKIDVNQYSNIYRLREVLGLEEGIDFKSANSERDNLLGELESILSGDEVKTLLVRTIEFKRGIISQHDFYEYLSEKSRLLNIDTSKYSHLTKFTLYVSIYEDIDKTRIMSEIDELEHEVREVLFENNEQRRLKHVRYFTHARGL